MDQETITNTGSDKELATPWYSDQILPFDITLTGANEYGAMCAAKIFGVEILNEGSGISIDDAVTEMSATFVARVVEPMSAVPSPFQTRDFRLLPRFGTIEKHYRQRREILRYLHIYESLAQHIRAAMIARLYRICAPAPARPRSPLPKLRHMIPKLANWLRHALKTAPHEPCPSGALPIISGAGVSRPSCMLACLYLLGLMEIKSSLSGGGDHIQWADRSDSLIRLYAQECGSE